MSRHLVTCLPEEDLSIGSHQAPPQVPSPAETGATRIVQTVQTALTLIAEMDLPEIEQAGKKTDIIVALTNNEKVAGLMLNRHQRSQDRCWLLG